MPVYPSRDSDGPSGPSAPSHVRTCPTKIMLAAAGLVGSPIHTTHSLLLSAGKLFALSRCPGVGNGHYSTKKSLARPVRPDSAAPDVL